MSSSDDWAWKIDEAVEIIRHRYDHIGRKTGAPFLALIYDPEAEQEVLIRWRDRAESLKPDFFLADLDVAEIVSASVHELGGPEAVAELMSNPMPGSDPSAELARVWLGAISRAVREALRDGGSGRPVAVLKRLAALHPVTTPRALMQALWDEDHASLNGPVVLLVPGRIIHAKNYLFLGEKDEFMYRGDIL
jgi:hypothetical protein